MPAAPGHRFANEDPLPNNAGPVYWIDPAAR